MEILEFRFKNLDFDRAMVVGIEKFREKLGAYSESYIIIGGTACDLILSRLQYEPRATVDIDMIVVVENLTEDFLRSFWEFVREGGYHPGVRVNEQGERKYAFYRFDEPTVAGYPAVPVKEGYADPISLVLTLRDEHDPRVEKEVEAMIEQLW